jgi:hypothetical protein
LIVGRDDGYRGPVIVKTDLNYGGMRELERRYQQGDMTSTINIQRPWRRVEWLQEYPVFNSPAEVPHGVWQNRKLVVEKFLPERNEAGEYVLRIWIFFGDREICFQCLSHEPVVKSVNTLRGNSSTPPPCRRRSGKPANGWASITASSISASTAEVALYDVNRTPGFMASGSASPEVAKSIRHLSAGLDSFIADTEFRP